MPRHEVLGGNVSIDCTVQGRDFGIRRPGFESLFFQVPSLSYLYDGVESNSNSIGVTVNLK